MSWPSTSPASRGYGAAWRRLRDQAMRRDGGLCQICKQTGRVTRATEVDHITPKSKLPKGHFDTLDQVQCLCASCHLEKTLREQGKTLRPTIGADGYPIE